MKTYFFNSFSKINLSLRVIKKLRNGMHMIQSLVTFANLCDNIIIKETNFKKDIIKFYGKFSYGINLKKNTITKTLQILRKYNYIKKNFFIIKIKKNIPTGSGLGGGSINSSALINFFLQSYKLKVNQKKLLAIAKKVGSDVVLGLKIKNTFLVNEKQYLLRTSKKLNFYLVMVNPGIKSLSKKIYRMNKNFSKPYPKKNFTKFYKLFDLKNLKTDRNDLEQAVFKQNPKIKNLNYFIKMQENCIFSRMTGSGSTCVGYFNKLQSAKNAKKNIKKKFPSYWCVTAKTM